MCKCNCNKNKSTNSKVANFALANDGTLTFASFDTYTTYLQRLETQYKTGFEAGQMKAREQTLTHPQEIRQAFQDGMGVGRTDTLRQIIDQCNTLLNKS